MFSISSGLRNLSKPGLYIIEILFRNIRRLHVSGQPNGSTLVHIEVKKPCPMRKKYDVNKEASGCGSVFNMQNAMDKASFLKNYWNQH